MDYEVEFYHETYGWTNFNQPEKADSMQDAHSIYQRIKNTFPNLTLRIVKLARQVILSDLENEAR